VVGGLAQAGDDLRVHTCVQRGVGDDLLEEGHVDPAGAGEGHQRPAGSQQFEAEQIDVLIAAGGLAGPRRGGGELGRGVG